MTPELIEAREKADAAKAALAHLGPAFNAVQGHFAARLREVAVNTPWKGDAIRNLALAQSIAADVRKHIEAIVLGGELAEREMARSSKIERMSPERRRILGL